jgi:hypothetical protein
MKITITFEINQRSPLLNDETKSLPDSLHEALCLAIHEYDEDALDWLANNVEDIVGE